VKHRTLAWVILLAASGLAAMAQAPSAGSQPEKASSAARMGVTKAAIIQAQTALLGTKEGQKRLEEMNKGLEPLKQSLDRKATEIRDLQDKLQRGGNAMTDTAKLELQRQIDQKTKSYNRDMQDAQDAAETEQRKMLDELTGKMQRVIENFATTHGYTLILDVTNPQTPVLWSAPENDITSDVIALYDKMYPSAGPSAPTVPSVKPTSALPKPPGTATPQKKVP